jgi:hypothetical protein
MIRVLYDEHKSVGRSSFIQIHQSISRHRHSATNMNIHAQSSSSPQSSLILSNPSSDHKNAAVVEYSMGLDNNSAIAAVPAGLFDPNQYRFVKRTPLRPQTNRNDIYITTARNKKILYKRSVKLLVEEGVSSVNLYALGAAIPVAIELALSLQSKLSLDYSDEHNIDLNPNKPGKKPLIIPAQLALPFGSRLVVSTNTSTETLIDDYEPVKPDLPFVSLKRLNSAVRIKLSVVKTPETLTLEQHLRNNKSQQLNLQAQLSKPKPRNQAQSNKGKNYQQQQQYSKKQKT